MHSYSFLPKGSSFSRWSGSSGSRLQRNCGSFTASWTGDSAGYIQPWHSRKEFSMEDLRFRRGRMVFTAAMAGGSNGKSSELGGVAVQPSLKTGETAVELAGHKKLTRSRRTPATALDPEKILVPVNFNGGEGEQLGDSGFFLGKVLGSGMQGSIYLVTDAEGKDAGRVFKQVSSSGPVQHATGNLVGIEREWVIGRQLNTLCEPDGFLPGFMQTGSKVIDDDDRFLGMMLEKLNGKDILKRIADPTFNDVDYFIELLRQVLTALDRAQTEIGFKHRDMRIDNVMEHRLPFERSSPKSSQNGKEEGSSDQSSKEGEEEEDEDAEFGEGQFGKKVNLEGLHFKIIDYGHAVVRKSEAKNVQKKEVIKRFRMPKIPFYSWEKIYRWVFKERGDVWRFLRSVGQAMEGRTWMVKDKARVRDLLTLIHHTSGVSVGAFFGDSLMSSKREVPLLQRLLSFGGHLFGLRWFFFMVKAYLLPGKPTMSPRDALHRLATLPSPASAVSKTSPPQPSQQLA